jgi:hypothetical protein
LKAVSETIILPNSIRFVFEDWMQISSKLVSNGNISLKTEITNQN